MFYSHIASEMQTEVNFGQAQTYEPAFKGKKVQKVMCKYHSLGRYASILLKRSSFSRLFVTYYKGKSKSKCMITNILFQF